MTTEPMDDEDTPPACNECGRLLSVDEQIGEEGADPNGQLCTDCWNDSGTVIVEVQMTFSLEVGKLAGRQIGAMSLDQVKADGSLIQILWQDIEEQVTDSLEGVRDSISSVRVTAHNDDS